MRTFLAECIARGAVSVPGTWTAQVVWTQVYLISPGRARLGREECPHDCCTARIRQRSCPRCAMCLATHRHPAGPETGRRFHRLSGRVSHPTLVGVPARRHRVRHPPGLARDVRTGGETLLYGPRYPRALRPRGVAPPAAGAAPGAGDRRTAAARGPGIAGVVTPGHPVPAAGHCREGSARPGGLWDLAGAART